MVRLQTQQHTKLMLQCGKGLDVKPEQVITSLYGLKVNQTKKSKDYYAAQRAKAIEILGHRYVLSKSMPRVR